MFSDILINLLSETQLGRLFGVFIQKRGRAEVREGGGAGMVWPHFGVRVCVACLHTLPSNCNK